VSSPPVLPPCPRIACVTAAAAVDPMRTTPDVVAEDRTSRSMDEEADRDRWLIVVVGAYTQRSAVYCSGGKGGEASRLDSADGDGVQRVPICPDEEARSSW
jgi:hypothetical protein